MTILQLHNRYQVVGGEDSVADAERDMLARHGHEVFVFERNNTEIEHYGLIKKASLLFTPTWSVSARKHVLRTLRNSKIDVAHVENFFPLLSPSVLYACAAERVPVVYTLHDWRLLCALGLLYRGMNPCTECLARDCLSIRGCLPALRYRCYRRSRIQTAAVVLMQIVHRFLRTWQKHIDIFIAPTKFVKDYFVEAGFPPEQIIVKPHFVYPDPECDNGPRKYALFVGRLCENKGIMTVLNAWKNIDYPLKVVGGGDLEHEVRGYVQKMDLRNVELCGQVTKERVASYIKGASCVIVPSLHHEGFGMIVIEAFACGVPVLASRRPPLTELIDDGRNGLLFEPGVPLDIVSKVRWLASHESELKNMGLEARKDFEAKFSDQANYLQLISIYEQAIERRATTRKKQVYTSLSCGDDDQGARRNRNTAGSH
jgi:glycosyltransferase involved in cell wall biosynthesis